MRLFENRDMTQYAIPRPLIRHAVLIQLHHKESHDERFRLHRTDTAQIHNHVFVKQFGIRQIIGYENHAVQPGG